MKAATIFMLSAALILVFCFTSQGRKSSGRTSSLVKRTDHGDSPDSLPGGRKHVVCICDQKKPYNLPRKRRHMNARRRHGHHRRVCARICRPRGAAGGLAVPIPLT